MRGRQFWIFAGIALCALTATVQADIDWPGLRGPNFDGSVRDEIVVSMSRGITRGIKLLDFDSSAPVRGTVEVWTERRRVDRRKGKWFIRRRKTLVCRDGFLDVTQLLANAGLDDELRLKAFSPGFEVVMVPYPQRAILPGRVKEASLIVIVLIP